MNWTSQIKTARLILRPHQESDYEDWYAGFSGRLPQQHPYDPGQEDISHCDRAWFSKLCQRQQQTALKDQSYSFGVFCRATNQHLGNIDLSTLRRDENQWAILGYEIHNQYWRRGFGKEAVRAALMSGFTDLNFHRIEAQINLDNHASIALAKSAGMQQECIRRRFIYENQQWVDHWIYAAIPPDLGITEKSPTR
ncbi:MAG: GNAT family N-acetyltransferase [Plectolyngbya sp. WJT66-NPBG17]|jgi:RimJ/RimL family protein N-acetyltransferase|nr:GNAT family N-acetyltransferase [Plectolyngbya sp. WJT66-NPBG17]MBW4525765.1 GNAT family N-acetyltransferase [Phormidium tanganyikae FI6-MK23]